MDRSITTGKPPATYQDLLTVPDHLVGEILGGELVTHPKPFLVHAAVLRFLGQELDPFDRRGAVPGGWRLYFAPEIHLAGNIVIPDMAGWRRERLPKLPGRGHVTVPPDWVCEILSPATARVDRLRKPRLFGQTGVAWYWLIDPAERTLEIIALSADRWTTVAVYEEEGEVRAPPFEAITFALSALWPEDEEA